MKTKKKRKFGFKKRSKQNFATTTTINATYAGQRAIGYLEAAMLSGNTLGGGFVTIRENVRYRDVLPLWDLSDDIVKGQTCDFTPVGNLALSERYLQPTPLEVNLQFCKKDFLSAWEVLQMGNSANKTVPREFSDFLMASVARKVGRSMETKLWQGSTAANGADDFNGYVTRISTDTDLPAAQELAGTAITKDNVLAQFDDFYEAIPVAVRNSGEGRMYVSNTVFAAYKRALTGFGAQGLGAAGVNGQGTLQNLGSIDEIQFIDMTVTRAEGLTGSQMFATVPEVLFFGTDLISDTTNIRLLDMEDNDGSNNFRYIANFSGDANYSFAGDITTYQIQNTVNG